jgi:hypothetical protein
VSIGPISGIGAISLAWIGAAMREAAVILPFIVPKSRLS